MSVSRLYISDACVLIDLFEVGLLTTWLRDYRCFTTDLVFAETQSTRVNMQPCADAVQECKAQGWLTVQALTMEELQQAGNIIKTHRRLSIGDASVFVKAVTMEGTVLTGDSGLRKLCTSQAVPIHGLVYILDELLLKEAINPQTACRCIREWARTNDRVPRRIVADRLERWGVD